ncbi:hypothetical protein CBC_0914 [Clostridium botulinum C str. Eklund]|nr:hypothetical protein CBC_0914 [Clostridium botulinum C str. Eklund]
MIYIKKQKKQKIMKKITKVVIKCTSIKNFLQKSIILYITF